MLTPPSAAPTSVADKEIASFVRRASERSSFDTMPALSAWQRKMEQYPQLSAQAQNELVAEFQEGRRAETELASSKRTAGAKERKMRAAITRGNYAIEMLAGSNFRLLLLIAREKAEERHGKDRAINVLPDLIGEANLALVEAASGFDPSKGPNFPTYLAKVVRDRMLAVLAREHAIKLPPSWVRVRRIHAVRAPKLAEELGRQPTMAETKEDLVNVCLEWADSKLSPAERAMSPARQRDAMFDRLRKQGMLGAIAKLEDVLSATAYIASTDAQLGDDGGTIGDMLAQDGPDVTQRAEAEEMAQAVRAALETLPERDREIVLYRYGFIDGECWTYQKISTMYGVSPERIRQIEKAVVARMRMPHERFSHLASFIDNNDDDD